VGGSDFLTPPAEAVDECAQRIGPGLGYYGTPDTVEDIELLRQHLDADRLTLDGTSYGSFTAAQYGLKYPDHVRSLVLDSVVPHKGFDPLAVDLLRESLAAKKTVPASVGTFPTHGGLFVGLVVGVILIVGGLTFFPALALGPIVEHLAMTAGQTFATGR